MVSLQNIKKINITTYLIRKVFLRIGILSKSLWQIQVFQNSDFHFNARILPLANKQHQLFFFRWHRSFLFQKMSIKQQSKQPWGFPGGSDSKESACKAGDGGSVPGAGRSPGDGNGYPLQYSCLENSMDRGAWWATVHGVAELDMTECQTLYFTFTK